uniref:MULE transposase domain-containing protein n=1 Tax=Ditylenchus dipsaci TaxID=166011 RepID=A0A915DDP8_9BILA
MDANNFLRNGRFSFGALGQAVGSDANTLMGIVQNALNQVPVSPVIQPIELQAIIEENDYITMVKSEKGNDKAVHREFQFLKNRKNKDGSKQDWRCENYQEKNGGCKASLQTVVAGNAFTKFKLHDGTCAHNHALDEKAVTLSNIKSNLKRRAVETREVKTDGPTQPRIAVSSASRVSKSKQQCRQKNNPSRSHRKSDPGRGRKVQDIDIPRESLMYTDGAGREQLFLLGDSGRDDPERILLFGKERHIDWSEEMKVMYVDGSFQITPPPFYQVYAFLAEQSARISNGGKYVFSVLYALLKNKSAASYTKMFIMVKVVWPAFAPTSISMDFEKVAIQSAIDVFPGVNISGCLFHLVKNFKKQIATHGLSTRNQETEFALRANMLMSLAFVPPENIWNDFRLLKTHLLAYDQALAPVINWFETYYVGTAMRDPMFPVRWWSCYERTLAGEDRTNNFAEAAHRRLHTALGVDHPNVARFLQDLKKI